MNDNNHNSPHPPQEKPTKSIWWLITGIACMILDVWLGYATLAIPYASKNFGTLFFIGLGFLVYYLK